jgi:hypothetical protein
LQADDADAVADAAVKIAVSILHLPWRNSAVRNDAAAEILDKALDLLHEAGVFDGSPETEDARKALAAAAGEFRVPSANRSKIAKALNRNKNNGSIGALYDVLRNVRHAINGHGFEPIFNGLVPSDAAEEIVTKHRFWDALPSGIFESDLWHAFMALWKADAFKQAYEHVGAPWDETWNEFLARPNTADPAVSGLQFVDIKLYTQGLIMRTVV